MTKRLLYLSLLLTLLAPAASAQTDPDLTSVQGTSITRYPLPTGPGEPLASWNGLNLYPYGSPFRRHVGRFLDATFTKDLVYPPPRTLRAKAVSIAPERDRVYMRIGEHFVSYALSSFFASDLQGSLRSTITVNHAPDAEGYVQWNGEVYPEDGRSGWTTYTLDGQQRLFDFDWDDRGYSYVAYSIWGFGILDADLHTVRQVSWTETAATPTVVTSFRSSGRYYLLVGGSSTELWDVTVPASPFLVRAMTDQIVEARVLTAGGSDLIALLVSRYDPLIGRSVTTMQLHRASGLLLGQAPMQVVAPTFGSSISAATSDGTNVFVIERPATGRSFILSILRPASENPTSYLKTQHAYSGMAPAGISYGDDHLTLWGSDDSRAYDVWLFRLDGLTPIRRPLGDFIKNYYTSQTPPSGYTNAARDGYTGTIYDALFVRHGGKGYLVLCDFGLGDVYELQPVLVSGDANGDSSVSTTDIFYLVNHLYAGGPGPLGSGDVDGSGATNAADVEYLINHRFTGGPSPR